MGFETFDRTTASRTTEPTLTVQRKGVISLSGPAMRLLMGDDVEIPRVIKIDLLYDPENKIVGIRQAAPNAMNPHLLRQQRGSEVYLVSGRLFVQHYGIDAAVARRYRAKNYGHGIVGACLADPCVRVGRKYKPRSKTRDEESGDEHWNASHATTSAESVDIGPSESSNSQRSFEPLHD